MGLEPHLLTGPPGRAKDALATLSEIGKQSCEADISIPVPSDNYVIRKLFPDQAAY